MTATRDYELPDKPGTIAVLDDITSAVSLLTIKPITTGYSLIVGDEGNYILEYDSATDGTFNVDTFANVAIPDKSTITVKATGVGNISANYLAGVTGEVAQTNSFDRMFTITNQTTDNWTVINTIWDFSFKENIEFDNPDTTIDIDEIAHEINLNVNDASVNGTGTASSIKVVADDAGTRYNTEIHVKDGVNEYKALEVAFDGKLKVTKVGSTGIDIERTDGSPSNLSIDNISDGAIVNYEGGSGGLKVQLEGVDKLHIEETGVISAPTSTLSGIATKGDKALITNEVLNATKYSETIGDGVSTTITITHNLGTEDLSSVRIVEVATKEAVIATEIGVDANNLNLTFSVAPTTDQYRVTIKK